MRSKWYYLVDNTYKPDILGADIKGDDDVEWKDLSCHYMIYFHVLCDYKTKSPEPTLRDPFNVELNGEIIFTLKDPEVIALITEQILKQK